MVNGMGSSSGDRFESHDVVAVAPHMLATHVTRHEVAVDGGGQRGRRFVEAGDDAGERGALFQLQGVVVQADRDHARASRAVSTSAGAISQPWRNRPLMRVHPGVVSIIGWLSGSAGRRLVSEWTMRASASAGTTLCAAASSSTVVRND